MENLIEKYRKLSPKEVFEFDNMVTITYHSCKMEGSTLTKEEVFWLCLEILSDNENKADNDKK